MDKIACLQAANVDVVHSLERFGGNEQLYLKFIEKFPYDENMQKLRQAIASERNTEALAYAHTLKGVGANLGMEELSGLCAQLMEKFRSGKTEGVTVVMEQLDICYAKLIQTIKKF